MPVPLCARKPIALFEPALSTPTCTHVSLVSSLENVPVPVDVILSTVVVPVTFNVLLTVVAPLKVAPAKVLVPSTVNVPSTLRFVSTSNAVSAVLL